MRSFETMSALLVTDAGLTLILALLKEANAAFPSFSARRKPVISALQVKGFRSDQILENRLAQPD
jgi:hypothetical protein